MYGTGGLPAANLLHASLLPGVEMDSVCSCIVMINGSVQQLECRVFGSRWAQVCDVHAAALLMQVQVQLLMYAGAARQCQHQMPTSVKLSDVL